MASEDGVVRDEWVIPGTPFVSRPDLVDDPFLGDSTRGMWTEAEYEEGVAAGTMPYPAREVYVLCSVETEGPGCLFDDRASASAWIAWRKLDPESVYIDKWVVWQFDGATE